MTTVDPIADISKSVTILNSNHHLARYAVDSKTKHTEVNSMTIETLLRSIDGRLQSMDTRLDNMDRRLENVDKRLDTVDVRLHKIGEDIVELKVETAATGARVAGIEKQLDRAEDRFGKLEASQHATELQLIRVEGKLERLPSWKSVGATSAAVTVSCCSLFVWLAEGGAKKLAGFFE